MKMECINNWCNEK